jgi:hypothetical protein
MNRNLAIRPRLVALTVGVLVLVLVLLSAGGAS